MRLSILALTIYTTPTALAFSVPCVGPRAATSTSTEMVSRRESFGAIMGTGIFLPQVANAFSQQLDDYAYEPQQQPTDGRLDLNAAFVVSDVTC